ncbi:MAG: transketolase [Actinomycetota bacterium]|nr:transketolase [Actinomycetota bacterium]
MTEPDRAGVADRYRYEDLPTLMTRMTGDEKHAPSATSTLDVLWVLYDRVLRVTPSTMDDPDRDRFLLSKGHGPMAYYAVLAAKGFIPVEWLDTFGQFDSPLGHHPDRVLVPGVEISSGSLGHGLPIAVGVALGQRAQDYRGRTYVLVGDAELDEGTNHEAIAYAGATGLNGLTAVVVDNQSATHGWPGGIAARFSVNGWSTATVDGRDHAALEAALTTPLTTPPLITPPLTTPLNESLLGRPHVVVAVVEPKEE